MRLRLQKCCFNQHDQMQKHGMYSFRTNQKSHGNHSESKPKPTALWLFVQGGGHLRYIDLWGSFTIQ